MDLDYFKKIAKIYCMLLPDPTPCPNVAVLTASRIIVHLSFGCLDKVNYWVPMPFPAICLKLFHVSQKTLFLTVLKTRLVDLHSFHNKVVKHSTFGIQEMKLKIASICVP